MNSYVLIKNKNKGKQSIHLKDGISMSFSKIHIPLVRIYNESLKKQVITMKVLKKYQKLLQRITFYFNAEDDSGVACQEVLSEIEKFFQTLKNKHRKYLLEQQLEEMEKTLSYLKKMAAKRLQILERRNIYVQSHSRGAK